jgi:hypothetical protein
MTHHTAYNVQVYDSVHMEHNETVHMAHYVQVYNYTAHGTLCAGI